MEFQNILQTALETEKLKIAIKEESNDASFLPVVIVTNGVMSEDVDVIMFGEKVQFVKDKEDSQLIKEGHPYIYMLKCDIREKRGKAEFEMAYRKSKISIKLKREDEKWIFKSSLVKRQKGKYSYEVDF